MILNYLDVVFHYFLVIYLGVMTHVRHEGSKITVISTPINSCGRLLFGWGTIGNVKCDMWNQYYRRKDFRIFCYVRQLIYLVVRI